MEEKIEDKINRLNQDYTRQNFNEEINTNLAELPRMKTLKHFETKLTLLPTTTFTKYLKGEK